jgi:hypothetical protein
MRWNATLEKFQFGPEHRKFGNGKTAVIMDDHKLESWRKQRHKAEETHRRQWNVKNIREINRR